MKNVKNYIIVALPVLALTCLNNCGAPVDKKQTKETPMSDTNKIITTASGLRYKKTKEVADGAQPKAGQKVRVHYTGQLIKGKDANDEYTLGKKFDSSLDRGEPFVFTLGRGQVIKGWDEGIALLKKGEEAELYIPYQLAYGDRAVGGGLIPAKSDLYFKVQLLDIL